MPAAGNDMQRRRVADSRWHSYWPMKLAKLKWLDPLHSASRFGNQNVTRLFKLLDHGADVDAGTRGQQTARYILHR